MARRDLTPWPSTCRSRLLMLGITRTPPDRNSRIPSSACSATGTVRPAVEWPRSARAARMVCTSRTTTPARPAIHRTTTQLQLVSAWLRWSSRGPLGTWFEGPTRKILRTGIWPVMTDSANLAMGNMFVRQIRPPRSASVLSTPT